MSVLLDSALPGNQARFSYIAVDPFRVIRCANRPWATSIDGIPHAGDPLTILAAELAAFKIEAGNAPTPFFGGAVGFFAYELGGALERLPAPKSAATVPTEDMVVGLYDTVAAFDLEKREAWVLTLDFPQNDGRTPPGVRAERLAAALGTRSIVPAKTPGAWRAETQRARYERNVIETIDAIRAGDIYQANISQRFLADAPKGTDSYALYLRLRDVSPAPFAAFLNMGDGLHILSASPERFLQADHQGRIETRPIKGTRPRGSTPREDQRMAADLVASGKDRAENLMIVDLLRNDLARVCIPGSISVPVLCGLETFPTVHHLVSVVTGRLRAGITSVDLLRATFPGGSVTGAPKIRAMEIIHALETAPRGPYCGAIAWLGFDGAMDSSIVIRTIVRVNDTLVAQAGGGIVAESDPSREYEESLTKVNPLLGLLRDN